MSRDVAVVAVAAVLLLLTAVAICLCAAASVDNDTVDDDGETDDLMDVADAVQDDDVDAPVPFVPTDWNAPDVLWLETIGVEL